MRRTPLVSAVLAAIVVLAGCAPASGGSGAPAVASSGVPGVAPTPAAVVRYDCAGRDVAPDAYQERTPLSSLGEEGAAALAAATQGEGSDRGFAPEDGWFVLAASDTDIEITRAVTERYELGNGEIPPDHEYLAAKYVGQPGEEPRWMVWSSAPCALRLAYEGLSSPGVTFETEPDPGSDRLPLLIHDHECDSGQSEEGRIQLVALEESDDRVELAFAVRPRNEGGTCQGDFGTPFSLALSAPLGDREVVDTGLVIPRPVGLKPSMGPFPEG